VRCCCVRCEDADNNCNVLRLVDLVVIRSLFHSQIGASGRFLRGSTRSDGQAGGKGNGARPRGRATVACLISLPGSPWPAAWVGWWVSGPRSIELRGTIVCCCFDFVAPGSERPDHASPSPKRAQSDDVRPRVIHRDPSSSQPSRLVFRSPSSYTAFPTVVICQVFYYINVVSISAGVPLNIQN
jgi:hypothetical protein